MKNIIEIENLRKYFGDIRAVDDISFSVSESNLFAFLGLNGAGKSTTINILCSILKKDSGTVKIGGFDLEKENEQIKRMTGIVFQSSVLDGKLSVYDNFVTRASYYGLRGKELKKRLEELCELLDLQPLMKRPFGKLSGGQKRRVDVARGLIHSPKLLFLDEPTTGLDPKTRQTVWRVIEKMRKDSGMTVFLTTHYMEEAAKADSVVIIDNGKIAANDTPNNLKKKYTGDFIKLYLPASAVTEQLLKSSGCDFDYSGECYRVKIDKKLSPRDFIITFPQLTHDFEVIKGDMDDVFLNVTGKKLEADRV